jgi:hypothetical protein
VKNEEKVRYFKETLERKKDPPIIESTTKV